MTRLVFISDTHNYHQRLVDIPDGDFIVHCGDQTLRGTVKETAAFGQWFGSLSHRYKVCTPGNHDRLFQTSYWTARSLLPAGITLLHEKAAEIGGLKFYGSGWTPEFCGWALGYKPDEAMFHWAHLPEDLDVLVTHGPPLNILDRVPGDGHVGCPTLLERVLAVKPKIHAFGHIHCSYGTQKLGPTTFVNAALLDDSYTLVNKPIVVDL